MLADGDRSGERQFPGDRRGDQLTGHMVWNAEDNLQSTCRYACVMKCLGNADSRGGCFFRWLQDHRTTGTQSMGDLADHIGAREVPGSKGTGRAHRFFQNHMAVVGSATRNDPAVGAAAFFAAPAGVGDDKIHFD